MVIYLFFYIILYPFVDGWYNVFLFQFWEISVPFHCEVRSGISCIWQHSLFVLPLRTKHRSWIRGSWGSFYFSDPRVTTGLCHDGHAREQSVRLLHNGISVGSRPGLSPVWMGILKSFNSSVTLGSLAPEEIHGSSSSIRVSHITTYLQVHKLPGPEEPLVLLSVWVMTSRFNFDTWHTLISRMSHNQRVHPDGKHRTSTDWD